jgi:hypothetical protein
MQKIPFDVIINHIIPYTYNIQSSILLEDIENYYRIKETFKNRRYNINMIKHEIFAIFYDNKCKLSAILQRHFQMKLKKDYNIIYNFSNNQRFTPLRISNAHGNVTFR